MEFSEAPCSSNDVFKNWQYIDFDGDDIERIDAESLESCINWCLSKSNCPMYTWNSKEKVCMSKFGTGIYRYNIHRYSGMRCSRKPNSMPSLTFVRLQDYPTQGNKLFR